MDLPLKGIRIIDLTRILAGPSATQMLADLGAEVIKIERPETGDDTRSWGPPNAHPASASGHPDESAYFLGANRGKKSVAIDLKSIEGARLVREMALGADVFIENFKVGDLQRYKLDPSSLHERNSGLIYCSITGFGQPGQRADTSGYDLMIQGVAGLMSITGQPDSVAGGEPMKVGVAVVDILTGLHAVIGILAALKERSKTGKGCHIDLSLFDVCAASLANQAMNWLIGGIVPDRMGNVHPNIVPYQTFVCSDGHFILAVGNDVQFVKLCHAVGKSDLAKNPKFVSNSARVENREELVVILASTFLSGRRDHWLELLTPLGIPCGPINSIQEVFDDPQAQARRLIHEIPHYSLGTVPTVANPIRFDGVSMTSMAGPPTLGQHSSEVLGEMLDVSDEEISALLGNKIISDPPDREQESKS
jgi:crotonobetainyl-CoA:carnitine CoA-transferase CaiB-like acyl-CoA transferase